MDASPSPAPPRIRRVRSFEELTQTPLIDGLQALEWSRDVPPGDFARLAHLLAKTCGEGITPLDFDELDTLSLSPPCRIALASLRVDFERLLTLGLHPELNLINGCYLDATGGPLRTDVCSWHIDSATAPADTWLCTYFGAVTEGLIHEDALRRVDQPDLRALLLHQFGGTEGSEFDAFLAEHCYDLHYQPRPGAQAVAFGIGQLWRVTTLCPGAASPPFVHRAPESPPGAPRLLLIA
ncbi:MAG: hypothetical protein KDK99_21280 [Verrucomicrobiales bacterium]|nr:hypothetical protein [Verrucomicrobiales bacterium]